MAATTRRNVIGLLLGVGTVAPAGWCRARAAEEKLLTPEMLLAKQFQGPATVEFTVSKVGTILTDRMILQDESEPLHLTAKVAGKKSGEVYIIISWETATRLKRLGIPSPVEHFRGKVVEVSGTVERLVGSRGPEYRIVVSNLDQIRMIRKP